MGEKNDRFIKAVCALISVDRIVMDMSLHLCRSLYVVCMVWKMSARSMILDFTFWQWRLFHSCD